MDGRADRRRGSIRAHGSAAGDRRPLRRWAAPPAVPDIPDVRVARLEGVRPGGRHARCRPDTDLLRADDPRGRRLARRRRVIRARRSGGVARRASAPRSVGDRSHGRWPADERAEPLLGGERAHGCGRHGRRRGWRRCDGRDRRGSGRAPIRCRWRARATRRPGPRHTSCCAACGRSTCRGSGSRRGPSSPPRGAYRRPPPPSAMWRARRCAELRPGAAQPGAAASGSSRSAHGRPTAASRDLCGYCRTRRGAASPTRFSSRSRVATTCSQRTTPTPPAGR